MQAAGKVAYRNDTRRDENGRKIKTDMGEVHALMGRYGTTYAYFQRKRANFNKRKAAGVPSPMKRQKVRPTCCLVLQFRFALPKLRKAADPSRIPGICCCPSPYFLCPSPTARAANI